MPVVPKGKWMLVLHAHLPFVRHTEYEDALEERWLYEAITETYLPLLDIFERLLRENIDFRVTMSITPPLANMLSDPLLQDRYAKHIDKLVELAEKEIFRTHFIPELNKIAKFYHERLLNTRNRFFELYHKNVLSGFRHFQDLGKLEIITCGATHGFLPLMEMYPNAVRAQILTATKDYERHFGRKPVGMWNAECGYYPGLEQLLAEGDIRYFYVDTHGLLHADHRPKYGVFAPMVTPNGVAYFGRDVETSNSVWSQEDGYPGDPNYREFYRDIGFDLELDYLKPYIHESGLRIATGLKYHRITGKEVPLEAKAVYDPEKAWERTRVHARDFVFNREKQVEHLSTLMDREPLVVSMYDAELFGHWWFEGPEFIYQTLKAVAESEIIGTITAPEYLHYNQVNQVATPPLCSWGWKGYNEFWLNETNDWIYPHLYHATELLINMANRHRNTEKKWVQKTLNQAARELLLAQSSDWAFIMRTKTMVEYAVRRTKDHMGRVNRLCEMVKNKKIDKDYVREWESRDNIFPEIDFRVYADLEGVKSKAKKEKK